MSYPYETSTAISSMFAAFWRSVENEPGHLVGQRLHVRGFRREDNTYQHESPGSPLPVFDVNVGLHVDPRVFDGRLLRDDLLTGQERAVELRLAKLSHGQRHRHRQYHDGQYDGVVATPQGAGPGGHHRVGHDYVRADQLVVQRLASLSVEDEQIDDR